MRGLSGGPDFEESIVIVPVAARNHTAVKQPAAKIKRALKTVNFVRVEARRGKARRGGFIAAFLPA
jgi:hypothetical protein